MLTTEQKERLRRCIGNNDSDNCKETIQKYSIEELMERVAYGVICYENGTWAYPDESHYTEQYNRNYASVVHTHMRSFDNALSFARACRNEAAIAAITDKFLTQQWSLVTVSASSTSEKSPLHLAIEHCEKELARTIIEMLNKELHEGLHEEVKSKIMEMLYSALKLTAAFENCMDHRPPEKNQISERIIEIMGKDEVAKRLRSDTPLTQSEILRSVLINCDSEILQTIITELDAAAPIVAMKRDGFGHTALFYAVKSGDLGKIKIILDLFKKEQFAQQDLGPKIITMLYSALNSAFHYIPEAANLIINKISEDKVTDRTTLELEKSLLSSVVQSCNVEALKKFLSPLGDNAAATTAMQLDANHHTALDYAIQSSNLDKIKTILDLFKKEQFTQQDLGPKIITMLYAALALALSCRIPEAVNLIIDKISEDKVTDKTTLELDKSLLSSVVQSCNVETLKKFLAPLGDNAAATMAVQLDANHHTALDYAIKSGNLDKIKTILDLFKKEQFVQQDLGPAIITALYAALALALSCRIPGAVNLIIDKISEDKVTDRATLKLDEGMLGSVVQFCDVETLKKFLAPLGNNVAATMAMHYCNVYTALHYAIQSDDPNKIKAILDLFTKEEQLKHIITLQPRGGYQTSLLKLSITENKIKSSLAILDLLDTSVLNKEMKAKATDMLYSALALALEKYMPNVVSRIIGKINEDKVTDRATLKLGKDLLGLVVKHCDVETLKKFLAPLGDNVTAAMAQYCDDGVTPLYYAVESGDRSKSKIIIGILGIEADKIKLARSCILVFIKEELFPQLLKGETLLEKHRALFDKDEYRQALKEALFEHCDHNGKTAKSNLEILKSALDPQTKLGAIFTPCSAHAAFFGLVTITPADEIQVKIKQLQALIAKGDQKAAEMQRDEWLSLNNGMY